MWVVHTPWGELGVDEGFGQWEEEKLFCRPSPTLAALWAGRVGLGTVDKALFIRGLEDCVGVCIADSFPRMGTTIPQAKSSATGMAVDRD